MILDKRGYTSQSIYLFDGTVAQNVALGKPINNNRIKDALYQTNILEFLETHHEGINTIVGEWGITLSRGQCQRIAIAHRLSTIEECNVKVELLHTNQKLRLVQNGSR